MKCKYRAFTLAEILVVLAVMGIIAVLVLSSYLKSVHEVQYKTTYKKALNVVSNFIAREHIEGLLPQDATDSGRLNIFKDIAASFVVKAYIALDNENSPSLNSNRLATPDMYLSELPQGHNADYWIVTDDNLAYFVAKAPNQNKCLSKLEIMRNQDSNTVIDNSDVINIEDGTTNDSMAVSSCYVIYVDVNGLSLGPNSVSSNQLNPDSNMPAIENDQFPIYIGKDGATCGGYGGTITGRMVSSLK